MKQWIGYKAGSVALLTLSALVILSAPQTSHAQDNTQPKANARPPRAKQTRLTVEGIYLVGHTQTRFINGNIDSDFVYTTYLLLKDGTYHVGIPPVSLDEWDIAASRAASPKDWGRWQRKANGRIVMRPGDASQKEYPLNGLQATAAKPGERLDGVYSTLYANTSRIGSRTTSTTGFVGLHFFSDGRFQNNTSSSFSDNRAGGGGLDTNGHTGRSGTYTLSGYTLTFKYDDGKVARTWFYRPTDNIIYIGTASYTLERNAP